MQIYSEFDKKRKLHEAEQADLEDLKLLEELIQKNKNQKQ
jgi:hypothetical protein